MTPTGLPCPSPTPRAHSDSCPSSRWCHPTISSSVIPYRYSFLHLSLQRCSSDLSEKQCHCTVVLSNVLRQNWNLRLLHYVFILSVSSYFIFLLDRVFVFFLINFANIFLKNYIYILYIYIYYIYIYSFEYTFEIGRKGTGCKLKKRWHSLRTSQKLIETK